MIKAITSDRVGVSWNGDLTREGCRAAPSHYQSLNQQVYCYYTFGLLGLDGALVSCEGPDDTICT